jgi:hypothetical protein
MAFHVTGNVDPYGREAPFGVVFKRGETVLAQWPVSRRQGRENSAAVRA